MKIQNRRNEILLIIGLILICSCKKNNSWNAMGLNGKVKSIIEKHYEVENKFGEWTHTDLLYDGHNKTLFDKKGYYQSIDYFDYENNLIERLIPKRDNEGFITAKNIYNKEGKLVEKIKLNHSAKELVEVTIFDKEGQKTIQSKLFHKNNKIIREEYQIFAENKIQDEFTRTFAYDKNQKLISITTINNKGDIIQSTKFEYLSFDEYNNWVKQVAFGSDDEENPNKIVI